MGMNTVLARLRSTIALRKKQGSRDSSGTAISPEGDWDFGARQTPDTSLRVTITSPPPPRVRERTFSLGADSPTMSTAMAAYSHSHQRFVYNIQSSTSAENLRGQAQTQEQVAAAAPVVARHHIQRRDSPPGGGGGSLRLKGNRLSVVAEHEPLVGSGSSGADLGSSSNSVIGIESGSGSNARTSGIYTRGPSLSMSAPPHMATFAASTTAPSPVDDGEEEDELMAAAGAHARQCRVSSERMLDRRRRARSLADVRVQPQGLPRRPTLHHASSSGVLTREAPLPPLPPPKDRTVLQASPLAPRPDTPQAHAPALDATRSRPASQISESGSMRAPSTTPTRRVLLHAKRSLPHLQGIFANFIDEMTPALPASSSTTAPLPSSSSVATGVEPLRPTPRGEVKRASAVSVDGGDATRGLDIGRRGHGTTIVSHPDHSQTQIQAQARSGMPAASAPNQVSTSAPASESWRPGPVRPLNVNPRPRSRTVSAGHAASESMSSVRSVPLLGALSISERPDSIVGRTRILRAVNADPMARMSTVSSVRMSMHQTTPSVSTSSSCTGSASSMAFSLGRHSCASSVIHSPSHSVSSSVTTVDEEADDKGERAPRHAQEMLRLETHLLQARASHASSKSASEESTRTSTPLPATPLAATPSTSSGTGSAAFSSNSPRRRMGTSSLRHAPSEGSLRSSIASGGPARRRDDDVFGELEHFYNGAQVPVGASAPALKPASISAPISGPPRSQTSNIQRASHVLRSLAPSPSPSLNAPANKAGVGAFWTRNRHTPSPSIASNASGSVYKIPASPTFESYSDPFACESSPVVQLPVVSKRPLNVSCASARVQPDGPVSPVSPSSNGHGHSVQWGYAV